MSNLFWNIFGKLSNLKKLDLVLNFSQVAKQLKEVRFS